MLRAMRALAWISVGFVSLCACEDGASPPAVVLPGPGDNSMGAMDGAAGDPGDGGPLEDDAAAREAGVVDGTDVTINDCVSDGGAFEAEVNLEGVQVASLALDAEQGHLVYRVGACDIADNSSGLRYLAFGTTGAWGQPVDAVNVTPACSGTHTFTPSVVSYRDPSRGAQVVETLFAATNTFARELYRHELSPEMGSTVPGTALTQDPADALRNETRSVTAVLGERPFVVWVSEDTTAGTAALHLQQLGSQAAARQLVDDDAGHRPTWLALSELGGGGLNLLVWVNEAGARTGVWMLALDNDGAPQGSPLQLSERSAGGATVAAARHADGGAVAYAVSEGQRRLVRWQRVGADGQVVGDEQTLSDGNESARDVSMAAFGSSGYVVAHRLEVADQTPVLRLSFVDEVGRSFGTRDVTDIAQGGGPTQVAVGSGGRIVVLWTDVQPSGAKVRALRLVCD